MDTPKNTSIDDEDKLLYTYVCLPEDGCYAIPILEGVNQLYMKSLLIKFENKHPQLSNKIIDSIENNNKISQREWEDITNNFYSLTEESTDNIDRIIKNLKNQSS